MYGGSYGSNHGSVSYRPQIDYWGLRNEIKRKDGPQSFNYFELGPHEDNNVYDRYGGSMRPMGPMNYGGGRQFEQHGGPPVGHSGGHSGGHSDAMNWGQMWTRRPGVEGKFWTFGGSKKFF